MSMEMKKDPPEISIRLHRGVEPRVVRVVVETGLEEPDRLALGMTLHAFLAALESGLFGRGAVSNRSHRIEVRRESGVMVDLFEATFSRVAPQVFGALARMIGSSVPGVRRIEIQELHRDERTLLVRAFEEDTEATILNVDWQIGFASTVSAGLVVRFREPPSYAIAEKTSRVVRVWSEMVSLGAYPPSGLAPPRAVLQYVGPGEPEEVVFDFAALACAYDAFEVLFEALDGIHQEQPIEKVSIPYRPEEPRPPKQTATGVPGRIEGAESCGGMPCG